MEYVACEASGGPVGKGQTHRVLVNVVSYEFDLAACVCVGHRAPAIAESNHHEKEDITDICIIAVDAACGGTEHNYRHQRQQHVVELCEL